MGRTVQGSNPSEGEIFCSHSDRPWGPPYSCAMGTASLFPEVKQLGHGVNHVPLSSAKMKERVELYFTPCLGLYLYIINGIFIRRCLRRVFFPGIKPSGGIINMRVI